MPGGTGTGDWSFAADVADAKQQFSGGTAGSAAAGAAGGMIGGYLGSKIPGIGTDTPLGGYLGGVAGAAVGAGAVGGAAAAMAAAGPAAIAGMALIIGQGIYGVIKGAGAKDQARDDYRRVVGEATHGAAQINDPTGQGLGMGSMYTSMGHEFFLPATNYSNLKNKNMVGEYLDGQAFLDAGMQGNSGYWNDKWTDTWYSGKFEGGNSNTVLHAGNWTSADMAREQKDWEAKLHRRSNPQEYAQYIGGEGDLGRMETGAAVTARNAGSGKGWSNGEGGTSTFSHQSFNASSSGGNEP